MLPIHFLDFKNYEYEIRILIGDSLKVVVTRMDPIEHPQSKIARPKTFLVESRQYKTQRKEKTDQGKRQERKTGKKILSHKGGSGGT